MSENATAPGSFRKINEDDRKLLRRALTDVLHELDNMKAINSDWKITWTMPPLSERPAFERMSISVDLVRVV